MTRLSSTMRWDARLQWRNGFYYVALVFVIIWLLILSQVPEALLASIPGESIAWLLPAFVLSNLLVGTFYFIGGLLLLEKGEGTLEAQIVTPLRSGEYLFSKLATLTALSLLENGLLVGITLGLRSRFWTDAGAFFTNLGPEMFLTVFFFVTGVILAALILCLAGFLVVIRYDSVNEYLLPSILVTILLLLPLITYLASWSNFLLYLHPLQAVLLVLQAAWQDVAAWELFYGFGYSFLWIWLLYRAAHNAFYRFVISKEGVS